MAGRERHTGGSPADRRRTAMIAVAWFVRMRSSDKTPEDERRFNAWLAEDGSHASIYDGIEAAWDKAGELETLPGLQVMRQAALRPRTNFLTRALQRGRRLVAFPLPAVRPSWRFTAAAATVTMAALLTIGVFGLGPFMPEKAPPNPLQKVWVFETAEGERNVFTLPDGSRVTLTSDSQLTMRYCDQFRLIVLARGQGYFKVAHDSVRPFIVQAGSGFVKALGTEFDVYKGKDEVVVTLVDGQVEVLSPKAPENRPKSRRLDPGQQVAYRKSGLSEVHEVDAERAADWRNGRITVVDEPLLDVIDTLNRHSGRKLKVNRADPRMKRLMVTGQFTTGRPEMIVQYVRAAGIDVWTINDRRGNVVLRLRS